MLQRNNKILITLAIIFAFCLNPVWADGSSKLHSYRISLGRDLDGDHIPDTVKISQGASVYKVSVFFTTGRRQLQLAIHHDQNEGGLALQASDVDNDHNVDLLITSATSVRPVAVWLNQGKANFKKARESAYMALGPYTGPTFQRNGNAYQPNFSVTSSTDRLALPANAARQVDIAANPQELGRRESEHWASDSILQQAAPRGPPSGITL